ncbi:MAG TPA: NfeD family protein [Ktedonobacterales bacterium]|nr:NfeD family protein [Ktedonobacterales bacterium]
MARGKNNTLVLLTLCSLGLLLLVVAALCVGLTGVGWAAHVGQRSPLTQMGRADQSGATGMQFDRLTNASGGHIDLITFDQDIGPASARFLEDALGTAQGDGSTLVIITLNTPGGDVDSMESIVSAELASKVPIAVYVGDAGAHAASAGMFVALAAPIVAMAPDTRIGAASPIDVSGEDLGSTLKAKVENDLLNLINPIQASYHRSTTDADAAITNASAFDNTQAVQDDMVNLQASSREDLITQLNGYSANYSSGASFTLHTSGLPTQELQPSFVNDLETALYDPTFLFILFIIAAICIYLELSHPGAIVPGTIGGIALVLFIFGSDALQPNWGGLLLMLLAIILLAVDVRAHTHGVLTVGALISLVIGSLLFFDSNSASNPGQQGVSPYIIFGFALAVGLVAVIVLRFAIGAQLRRVTTGKEGLIGKQATVIEALQPDGRVMLQGENWQARLDPSLFPPDARIAAQTNGGAATALAQQATHVIEVGAKVRVVRVEGLRLIVAPVA